MTGDTELDILRALAYGPNGGRLDAVQLRRLEELEAVRRSAAPALAAAPRAPLPPADGRRVRPSASIPPVADGGQTAGSLPWGPLGDEDDGEARTEDRAREPDAALRAGGDAAAGPTRGRRSLRRRLMLAVVGVVVLVAAVAGYRFGAATLPPEPALRGDPAFEAESRAQAEGITFAEFGRGTTWDGGVRLLGELGGGHAWWGTIDDGARTCVVLTLDGGEHVLACDDTERVRAEGIEMGYGGTEVTAVSTDGTMRAQMSRTHVLAAPYSGTILVQTTVEAAR